MVARGNVRVTHEDELLEAQSLEYDHSTGTAIAIGEVKLKTNDGAEYRADKMFLDNNFKFALANANLKLLSRNILSARYSAPSFVLSFTSPIAIAVPVE